MHTQLHNRSETNLSWVWMYISFWAVPCTAYAAHMMVCCICSILRNCHCSSFYFIFGLCKVIASLSLLSIIHWCVSCFVLLCLHLLLHPLWAACTWGLLCFQLYLSLPPQEWTLKNTFRFARRRNDRGSIAGIDWRRAEVWIRSRPNWTV